MQSEQTKSISAQKIATYTKILQENESFWNALLVFMGAFALFCAIPFYPLFIAPFLALMCGAIAYRYPVVGTILGVLLIFPAFAYQSFSLGFLFMLITALVLFEVFTHWGLICALEILILLPFAQFPISFLGGFVMLGMVIVALNFGSGKSLLISIPSVFMILFLSSIWLYPNSVYMPLTLENYMPPSGPLQLAKPPVGLLSLPEEFSHALFSLFDLSKVKEFNEVLGKVSENIFKMLFSDSTLIQLIVWSFVLYMISFASGRIKSKRSQFFSSLFLLLIPAMHLFLSFAFGYMFKIEILFYVIASVGIIALLETKNIKLSKESTIIKKEKLKNFGKFGMRDLSLESNETFEDIGGYDNVKEEIKDAVALPLEQKELAYTYNLVPPHGILLFGPPGTGKTMIIRALANEISFRLYYVNTSELLSKWYGESEKNISELFADARKNAPCILMFDEIDSIGKTRSSYTDDVTPRILSVLLQELDGASNTKKPIIIIGTTNIPNELDPALLRPGRFDKIIYMPLPDKKTREEIFKVNLKKYPNKEIDYAKLARKTERFSGADIKNVINEAVLSIAKEAQKKDEILPIDMNSLLNVIVRTKSSVSIAHLEEYEKFQLDFERRMGRSEKPEEEKEGIRWGDVAGLEEIRRVLLEAIEIPLLHEELMKEYKIKPSKGILLFGPPGCGKTLIVRAASNELKASFIILSGAELMKKGYTQAVNVLKETFIRARENMPAIIFIDEIETIAPSRALGAGDIVGQLLTEMDGLKELKGVMVMGATNKPSILDPAILRPGRFDKLFYIPPPDFAGRKEILKINLGDFAQGVDLELLAQDSEGFSGADISSFVQTAKMEALRAKIAGAVPQITTQSLLKLISSRKPSITDSMLNEYRNFLGEYGERR